MLLIICNNLLLISCKYLTEQYILHQAEVCESNAFDLLTEQTNDFSKYLLSRHRDTGLENSFTSGVPWEKKNYINYNPR